MSDKLTEKDMQQFVAIGCPFPYSVPEEGVDADHLVEAVFKVLRRPAARTTKAAATALVYFATLDQLDRFRGRDLGDGIRRKLGFLSELMSQKVSADVALPLKALSSDLYHENDSGQAPLVLMAFCTDHLLEMCQQRATLLQKKWSVLSDVEPYVTRFDHV